MKLNEIVSTLSSFGVDNCNEEALLIIEHSEKISRAKIMADPQKSYTSPTILEILEKRREHIPLQHILGKWEFMGREFFVSPECLIPRPDTEILVEKAISLTKSGDKVIDLCTGSGCIGISIASYVKDIDLTLLDISSGALDMARKNAAHNGIYARFILGDIRKDIPKEKFDIITANPPYIPSSDIGSLSPEVKREPVLALDGGDDGLDFVRCLLSDGISYLNEGGKMLIEFGYDQEKEIRLIASALENISSYEILYDYGGNPRVLVIYK